MIRDRSVGHLVANLMDFFISQLPVRSAQQVDSARNILFLLIRISYSQRWFRRVQKNMLIFILEIQIQYVLV